MQCCGLLCTHAVSFNCYVTQYCDNIKGGQGSSGSSIHGNQGKCIDAFLMENTGEDTIWRIWKVNAKELHTSGSM